MDFNFSPHYVQTSIWTSGDNELNQSEILGIILSHYLKKYNGAPQVIPHNAKIPNNFIITTLPSLDGQWKIEATNNQINSTWVRVEDDTSKYSLEEKITECFSSLKTFLDENKSNIKIGRMACVVNNSMPETSSAELLSSHFCKDSIKEEGGPINRSQTFELHNHKQFKWQIDEQNSFDVNSWVRCRGGKVKLDKHSEIIDVQQDINTLSEERENGIYSPSDASLFFNTVWKELDSILDLYFRERT